MLVLIPSMLFYPQLNPSWTCRQTPTLYHSFSMFKCAGLDTINSITYICRQSVKKRVENQESELPGSAGKTMWPRMEAMWTCLGFWTNEDCFRTLKAYSARNLLQEALICIFLLFLYLGDPSRIRFAFSLNIYIYIYIFFFFQRKGISAWLFIIIYIFLFILKIIASVKNQHNLYFAVELQMGELQWTPRYREYKIFAVDLRLSSTFLLLKFVCCCFLVSRERKLVLLKSNVILLD